MIKYRPHQGSLDESMKHIKEFNGIDEMLDHIVSDWNQSDANLFNKEDLIVGENVGADKRIEWKETRYVCTKRMGSQIYDHPQCIGICSLQ